LLLCNESIINEMHQRRVRLKTRLPHEGRHRVSDALTAIRKSGDGGFRRGDVHMRLA
jgi:hypothetical protein